MNEVIDFSTTDLAEDFKWRTARGAKLSPHIMDTRHLFHTVRMIWNNTMPEPVPDNPKFYNFGPQYTNQYLKTALVVLFRELTGRKNLTHKMQTQLNWMRDKALNQGKIS